MQAPIRPPPRSPSAADDRALCNDQETRVLVDDLNTSFGDDAKCADGDVDMSDSQSDVDVPGKNPFGDDELRSCLAEALGNQQVVLHAAIPVSRYAHYPLSPLVTHCTIKA